MHLLFYLSHLQNINTYHILIFQIYTLLKHDFSHAEIMTLFQCVFLFSVLNSIAIQQTNLFANKQDTYKFTGNFLNEKTFDFKYIFKY